MRRLVALLALTALAACTNEIDESTRPQNIVGTYQLVSLGGKPLPSTTLSSSGASLEYLGGELVLAADKGWTETLSFRVNGGSQVQSAASSGTWTSIRDYAYLAFSDSTNGYQFTGTASGGIIVLETASGSEMIYRR
jgi:hypothetical protein